MKTIFCLALLAALTSCDQPPQGPITQHMGAGVVRTVEYWSEARSGIDEQRLVIETQDARITEYDALCEKRIPAWQGLVFKDMIFQYNREWQCYHIIEFVR